MRAEAGISGEVISAHPTKDRACFQFNRQKEKTMDLDKSRLIAGVSVKYLSDALRRCGSRFSVSALAKELGTEYEPSVVARLIGLQYLKREEAPDRDRLSLTDKGKHLAAVRGIVPMPRQVADAILADLLARVHRVNQDDWFLHCVERVTVFGSYLNAAAACISDVDVMVLLAPKEKDYDRFTALQNEKYRNSTRIFTPKFHPIFADYFDTLGYLGYRRRSLHLLPENEQWLLKKKVPNRILFPVNDANAASPVVPAAAVSAP